MTLYLDFETRSRVPLSGKESVGLWNYAHHESTVPLMLAYAFANDEVQIWEPHLGPMPADLEAALRNPEVPLGAFNSLFERYILNFKLGFDIKASRFAKDDSQVGGRYLSLPGDLESVCQILGLPEGMQKDKRGEQLIHLFSEPQKPRKKKNQPLGEEYFNDWTSHPVEWEQFKEYCKRDVIAERECARRMQLLQVMPLPEFEQRLWIADQLWNDRGIYAPRDFISKAHRLAVRSKKEAADKQNALTGLDNANSRDQLLPWVRARGFPHNSLRKETVEAVLANPEYELTEECRQALIAKREASSTSYQKLSAILRQLCPDDRLRNQFIFMGSSRCGRWSGNAVQLHNLARPSKEFKKKANLELARKLIQEENYEEIKARFGSVLLTVKNCLRTVFGAPEGQRLNIADLAGIETRVVAWIAQCQPLMDVFRNGLDAYIDFAAKMYGRSYQMIADDLKSSDEAVAAFASEMRQVSKVGVLSCVYRTAGGGWGNSKTSYIDPETGEKKYDKVKTGIWMQAENAGVEMSLEQAHEVVRIFRQSYREIPELWYALEKAVADVLDPKAVQTTRQLGPNGCILIDRLNITGRHPLLRIHLPDGRKLHYVDARMEMTRMPWDDDQGQEVWRETLVYSGQNQTTKQWSTVTSHGGKLTENITQAIARGVLAEKLLLFEANELPVVAHVHDEGVCETPDDPFSPGAEEMEEIMNRTVSWAPGLLLGSEAFQSTYYKKG